MSTLILGARGQLGQELVRVFPEAAAIDRTHCDLEDEKALGDLLERMAPACLINAAAYTNVDGAERDVERAHRVNAAIPGLLADYAARRAIPIVHYSTDYVFDGLKSGRYVESDVTRPLNAYGLSKEAGETAVRARCGTHGGRYLILRTSWLYGPTRVDGGNFIKTMLRLARQEAPLRVVADQRGVPTSARWLAGVTRDLLDARSEVESGTYHAVPSGETTWHGLATFAVSEARRYGLPIRVAPEEIEAIATDQFPTPACRPANSRLDNGKLARALRARSFPCWRTQVAEYVADLSAANA
jgi:dTDP-4-dehydrorhamnose reductase